MASLAGNSIASSYTSLLKLDGNTDSTVAGNNSNAIQVKTGDNDATPLFLNTDRLGIGGQPTYALQVKTPDGNAEAFGVEDNSSGRIFTHGVSGDAYYLKDKTANATRFYMNYQGKTTFYNNVGIGVDPIGTLDINISTDARGSFNSAIGEIGSGVFALQVTNAVGSVLKPMGIRAEDIRLVTGSAVRLKLDDNSRISLSNNDSGADNTIFGFLAGASIGSGHDRNTLIGDYAGNAVQGDSNTIIGRSAGKAITASNNTIVGDSALSVATIATENVVMGGDSMAGVPASVALTGAVAIGQKAFKGSSSTTTGANHSVAVGYEALESLTTGASNVAIGYQSQLAITDSRRNTSVGYQSLKTASTGDSNNTAIGYASLEISTTGGNTSVGSSSSQFIDTGENNTALGYGAMTSSGSGNDASLNVAVGYLAFNGATDGDQNTIIGASANPSAGTGSNQTVIGYNATGVADNSVTLGNASVTDVYMAQDSGATIHASNGVFIDDTSFITVRDSSSYSAGTGGGVAFQGLDSDGNLKQFSSTQGYSIGSNNGGLAIFTRDGGSNNLAVIVDNNRALKPGANDAYDIGTSSLRWDDIFATNGTIDTSDERRKENIKDTSLGLDFVNKLKPKEYKWKDYDYEHIDNQDGEEPKSITKTRTFKRKHQGLLAQDVEKTLKDIGLTNDDFAGIVYDEESDIYGLRYSQLIAPLIKAVQELSAKVTELEKK